MQFNKISGGTRRGGFLIFFLINPLLPEHPPSFSPIFIKPTLTLHYNFADLTIHLSIALIKRRRKKIIALLQLLGIGASQTYNIVN